MKKNWLAALALSLMMMLIIGGGIAAKYATAEEPASAASGWVIPAALIEPDLLAPSREQLAVLEAESRMRKEKLFSGLIEETYLSADRPVSAASEIRAFGEAYKAFRTGLDGNQGDLAQAKNSLDILETARRGGGLPDGVNFVEEAANLQRHIDALQAQQDAVTDAAYDLLAALGRVATAPTTAAD